MAKLSKKALLQKSKARRVLRLVTVPWLFLRALVLYWVVVKSHGGAHTKELRAIRQAIRHADRVLIFGASQTVLDFLDVVEPNDFVITLNSAVFLPIKKHLSFSETFDKEDFPEMWDATEKALQTMFANGRDDISAPDYFAITNLRPDTAIYNVRNTRLRQVCFYEFPWLPERAWAFRLAFKFFSFFHIQTLGLFKVRYSLSRAVLLSLLAGAKKIELYGVDGSNQLYFWQSPQYSHAKEALPMTEAWERVLQGQADEVHQTHNPTLGPMTVPRFVEVCHDMFPGASLQIHLPKT